MVDVNQMIDFKFYIEDCDLSIERMDYCVFKERLVNCKFLFIYNKVCWFK